MTTKKPRTEQEAHDHPTLHERMLAVAKEASYVHRDASSGQWTAASYDQVVGKLRPWLLKHGVLVYPDAGSFRVTPNGNQLLIEAGLRFVNSDDPKDFIVVQSCCMGTQNSTGQEQLAGKLQTYCYKAALRYGLLLKTGDDPDLEARDPGVDVPPEIQAKIDRIRELVAQVPGGEDVEAFIREKLVSLSRKYNRPVSAIEGLPEKLLDGWAGQMERQVEEITGKSTKPASAPRGNGKKKDKPSGSTPAPAVEVSSETPAAMAVAPAGADPEPDAPADEQKIRDIPPDERGAHIIAWLSQQRGDVPQGIIRNAFGGWMFHAKHRNLADDDLWVTVWGQREEILADLDERVAAKP